MINCFQFANLKVHLFGFEYGARIRWQTLLREWNHWSPPNLRVLLYMHTYINSLCQMHLLAKASQSTLKYRELSLPWQFYFNYSTPRFHLLCWFLFATLSVCLYVVTLALELIQEEQWRLTTSNNNIQRNKSRSLSVDFPCDSPTPQKLIQFNFVYCDKEPTVHVFTV